MNRLMIQKNRNDFSLHIALIRPEIPQNTGNIGRLSLGIGACLHLIHPLGFRLDEKSVRRAGLDYWKDVAIKQHETEQAFWQWASNRRCFLFSTKGKKDFHKAAYQYGDVLVFGAESQGLSPRLLQQFGGYRIPISDSIRSLNLSNSVAIAAYTALISISKETSEWFTL